MLLGFKNNTPSHWTENDDQNDVDMIETTPCENSNSQQNVEKDC